MEMIPRASPPELHAALTVPAQRSAVDRLSDDGFPVENLDIVGSGLRLVERVTGRLTRARATGAGALSGLWAGLLVGILVGLFTSGHSFLAVIVTGAALGAGWGAAFGYLAHARTRGERDFSPVRGLTATHYDLIAREGTVDRARLGPVDGELGDDVVAVAHPVQDRRPERGLVERNRRPRLVKPQFRLDTRHTKPRYRRRPRLAAQPATTSPRYSNWQSDASRQSKEGAACPVAGGGARQPGVVGRGEKR